MVGMKEIFCDMWKWYEASHLRIHKGRFSRIQPGPCIFTVSTAASTLQWQLNSCNRDYVACKAYDIYSLALKKNVWPPLIWKSRCRGERMLLVPCLSKEPLAGVPYSVKGFVFGEVTLAWDLRPRVALKAIVSQGQAWAQGFLPGEGHVTMSIKSEWRDRQPCAESSGSWLFAIYHHALNIQQSEK